MCGACRPLSAERSRPHRRRGPGQAPTRARGRREPRLSSSPRPPRRASAPARRSASAARCERARPHLMAVAEQLGDDLRADETHRAGHEKLRGRPSIFILLVPWDRPLRGARHHAHHGTAPLQQPSCPGRVAPFPDLGTRPTLRHSPTSMRFRLLAAQFLVNSIPYRRLGRSAFRRARRSLLRLRAS